MKMIEKTVRENSDFRSSKNLTIVVVASLFLIFLMSSVSAVSDNLRWVGQYYNSTNSSFNVGLYNFTFTVYDDATAGSSCWSASTLLNTTFFGAWEYNPSGVSLACNNQSKDYFLNINVNGTDQNPRKRLVLFEYLREFGSNVSFSNILSNVTVYGNLTAYNLFGNISYTYIQNAPWLTAETNWNSNSSTVARIGNCPAGQVVMNTTTSGVQCVSLSSTSSNVSEYFNYTTTSYDGNMGGYITANGNCNSEFAGTHMCTFDEIKNSIDLGHQGNFTNGISAWSANGFPGYTANANDCYGWTSDSTSYLGPFWAFNNTRGGEGWLVSCAATHPIACCK